MFDCSFPKLYQIVSSKSCTGSKSGIMKIDGGIMKIVGGIVLFGKQKADGSYKW